MNNTNCSEVLDIDSGSEPYVEISTEEKIVGQERMDGINNERLEKELKQENIEGTFLKKIESLFENLSGQISDMEQLFNKRIMHADYEDRIIDQMHAELQKYKENLYSQLVRPILLDVIEVRDSIIRIATDYLEKPEGEQSIPNKVFADYAYDLQEILEKNNVQIYRSKSEELFVPVKQRVVKKKATPDECLHGRIAESLSDGYSYEGHVISAEKVSVFIYENKLNLEESEESING